MAFVMCSQDCMKGPLCCKERRHFPSSLLPFEVARTAAGRAGRKFWQPVQCWWAYDCGSPIPIGGRACLTCCAHLETAASTLRQGQHGHVVHVAHVPSLSHGMAAHHKRPSTFSFRQPRPLASHTAAKGRYLPDLRRSHGVRPSQGIASQGTRVTRQIKDHSEVPSLTGWTCGHPTVPAGSRALALGSGAARALPRHTDQTNVCRSQPHRVSLWPPKIEVPAGSQALGWGRALPGHMHCSNI